MLWKKAYDKYVYLIKILSFGGNINLYLLKNVINRSYMKIVIRT